MQKEKRKIIKEFVKTLDTSQAIDLSTLFTEIMPNKYFLFREGGPHYLWQCETEEVPFPFDSWIWPFIMTEGISNRHGKKIRQFQFGSIPLTKLSYITGRFDRVDQTYMKRAFRTGDIEEWEKPKQKEMFFHRIVAKAFCPDYADNKIVDHIDGNRLNYMIQNLRWIRPVDNCFGNPGGRNDPDEVFRLIKEKDWWNKKGVNMMVTKKKIYEEKKLNS